MARWVLLACFAGAFAGPGAATTIRVPTDAPTIQAGIDDATPGDTVLVACGFYFEFDLAMKSGIQLRSESGEPSCVTVFASRQGPVLRCFDVEASTCIRGIKLTAGLARGHPSTGGGVLCVDSAPRFENCHVEGNEADEGAGIGCVRSSPTLVDCVVSSNVARLRGGGVHCGSSSPTFTRCHLSDNTVTNVPGEGGGLYCVDSSPSFEACVFFLNFAISGAGGFCDAGSYPVFETTVFEQNVASGSGGAAHCRGGGSPRFASCTFVGNVAFPKGAALYTEAPASPVLAHTIVAFNGPAEGVFSPDLAPTLACTDVFGNAGGDWVGVIADQLGMSGNFSADPLFCDRAARDYTLEAVSPCAPPGATGCGLVGALPVGCGTIPVESATWARIKDRYRD